MIPTIETIVEDLAAGKITKQQAIAWLYQHAEEAGYALRDEFAKCAMQGLRAHTWPHAAGYQAHDIARLAYEDADAMLAIRTEATSEAAAS